MNKNNKKYFRWMLSIWWNNREKSSLAAFTHTANTSSDCASINLSFFQHLFFFLKNNQKKKKENIKSELKQKKTLKQIYGETVSSIKLSISYCSSKLLCFDEYGEVLFEEEADEPEEHDEELDDETDKLLFDAFNSNVKLSAWPILGCDVVFELAALEWSEEELFELRLLPFEVECKRWCNFKCTSCVNFESHLLHSNGRSPLCNRKCVFKFDVDEKRLPHVGHGNGFSPVCTKMCFCKWASCVNPFGHESHLNGLSPVWTLKCTLRFDNWPNVLLHSLHS